MLQKFWFFVQGTQFIPIGNDPADPVYSLKKGDAYCLSRIGVG